MPASLGQTLEGRVQFNLAVNLELTACLLYVITKLYQRRNVHIAGREGGPQQCTQLPRGGFDIVGVFGQYRVPEYMFHRPEDH